MYVFTGGFDGMTCALIAVTFLVLAGLGYYLHRRKKQRAPNSKTNIIVLNCYHNFSKYDQHFHEKF